MPQVECASDARAGARADAVADALAAAGAGTGTGAARTDGDAPSSAESRSPFAEKPQDPPLVEIEGLTKHYRTAAGFGGAKRTLRAVDGVSLAIRRGETLGLVGESGCGKSTTGQMAARLLAPTGGRILFRGTDVAGLRGRSSKELRRSIQYVFQDPYASLNPRLPVSRLLEEPLLIHRIGDKRERARRVEEMLERIGLGGGTFGNRYTHELSGGQRQRIGIARALMLEPEFLILDEPVSALDVSVQSQILNLLKELQARLGLTYLFISHDLNVVHYMSDRIAVMYLGKVVELAEVRELYEKPLHPYTQALVSAIPAENRRERRERIVLKGDIPSASAVPSGCAFHTRCPFAFDRCRAEAPVLRPAAPHEGERRVSCHLYSGHH
ncbi:ATP-binding cassette domain-containing protein [Cohnella xylanilytica]|uniref:ATP-binding cassette domain-containing protein n=1 Tax=Cohnella xylanilytica TaxID=557555 RepID=A0A841TRJ5_9BACL|nr:oligopeptide/dipeptide ABC transporter ATP-binding protein [Cohnella xylanilytica]MBB6691017.1 ATP-binding cassette domain-containing protein [Cohnella xylanilytica]